MTDAQAFIAMARTLRAALRALLVPVWGDTKACTATLTDVFVELCEARGATVEREARSDLTCSSRGITKQGRIDLVAAFPDGSRLAVEIDRAFKRWSVDKLVHFQSHESAFGLWVRWDNHRSGEWVKGVAVVGLPASTSAR